MTDPYGEEYLPDICENDCDVENCIEYCDRILEHFKQLEKQSNLMLNDMAKDYNISKEYIR